MPGPLDDLLTQQYGGLFAPSTPTVPTQIQPQERESLLRQLANMGVSGLQALGYVLDIPGRPVRSALAGRFGDILPSILDSSRAPSGEDLAKQWGLLQGEGTKGQFEMRDLVGPALEIATNPTSYINPIAPLVGGARTAAGNAAAKLGRVPLGIGQSTADLATAAQASGKLAPTLASRIAAGQGGLFNLGLPGTEGLTFGTGPTAQAIAERIGGAQSALGATAPARTAKALFGKVYENTTSPFLQPVLKYGDELARPLEAEGKGAVADLARKLGPDFGASEVPLYQAQLAQRGLSPDLVRNYNDVLYGISEGFLNPETGSKLGDVGQQFSQLGRDIPTRLQQAGVKAPAIENYAPRRINPELSDAIAARLGAGRPQLPLEGHQVARDVPDAFVVGKTLGLNLMSLDPEVAGALKTGRTAQDIQQTILQRYMGGNAAGATDAEKLAGIMGNLDPTKVSAGKQFYNPDFLSAWTERAASAGRTQAKAQAMLEGLAKKAIAPTGDSVPLADVLKSAGFGDTASSLLPNPGAHVPREVAADVARYAEAFARPESISPLLKGFDAFINLFKVGVSTVFPASRMRDAWQNVFMNFVKGNRDTRFGALNPLSYYRPYEDAYNAFLRGGIVRDANTIDAVAKVLGPNATPEQATKFLADRAYAFGLIEPGAGSQAALVKGGMSPTSKGFTLPGEKAESIVGSFTEPGLTWDPLAISKVGGNVETTNRLAVAGNRAITQIDHMGRGAAFIAQLRQGATFEQAARAATEAMYDYGNLSKFERSVMQRVIPFYSFMRQNMPAQLEELVKNPGGALANSVRITNSLRRDQGFVPENVGEGLALPIGTDDSTGRTKYLTHFGLPFEEATGPVTGSVAGTLRNLISETTPLIKGPVELAAGRSMYTGKPLQPDEGLLANTAFAPLQRIASTARTLASPSWAGAVETLSPFKVREANVQGAQNAAARESIQELLAGNPAVRQFTNISVKPEDLAQLSPRDRMLLQLYRSMQQQRKPQTVP